MAASGGNVDPDSVNASVQVWRPQRDSNPGYLRERALFSFSEPIETAFSFDGVAQNLAQSSMRSRRFLNASLRR